MSFKDKFNAKKALAESKGFIPEAMKFQQKQRKKFGDDGDELQQLDANIIKITPEMKEKILTEGLPSFAMGGLIQDIDIFS